MRSTAVGPADIIVVVEMADSPLECDRRLKAQLYAETGVREYWVADLNGDCVFVYWEPRGKASEPDVCFAPRLPSD